MSARNFFINSSPFVFLFCLKFGAYFPVPLSQDAGKKEMFPKKAKIFLLQKHKPPNQG
jgi:hypothetical protein